MVTTLGPAYNEQNDAKETARYKWVLVVTELFNMAVSDFDAKQSACYSRMFFVTELVLSGTQCRLNGHFHLVANFVTSAIGIGIYFQSGLRWCFFFFDYQTDCFPSTIFRHICSI